MKHVALWMFLAVVVGTAPSMADSTPVWLAGAEDCAAPAAAGPLAFDPAPLDQAISCGPYCDCPGCYTTSVAAGTGTSCAQALSALTATLHVEGQATCGTRACQLVVTQTSSCLAAPAGRFVITGFATHGCRDSTC